MGQPALLAQSLRRVFGDRTAVDGVSVRIEPGQIVSILGPNGAGKTTTVRMCSTLLTPTSGSISVAGVDALAQPRQARRMTGLVLGGDSGFYSRATARKNLLFFADVAGVRGSARRASVEAALESVSLTDRADDKVRDYSRGMKQRLHIARALLGQPQLLLLDEPTNGLDPHVASDIRQLVRTLAESGVGILLTSHYLAEVQQLAHHIQVIVQGKEIAQGTAGDIAAASGLTWVTSLSTEGQPESLVDALGGWAGKLDISQQAGVWQVRIPWKGQARSDLIEAWLSQQGLGIPVDLVTRPATLEENYLALVDGLRQVDAQAVPDVPGVPAAGLAASAGLAAPAIPVAEPEPGSGISDSGRPA